MRENSRHPNRYPVIVCTSAGEVGLNMAWATTLVHWDLHPNPQKLEQRTWRLDRRLRADGMNERPTRSSPSTRRCVDRRPHCCH